MGKVDIKRTAIFHDFYSRLKNIALSVFEWENLPSTCNARFLEDTLFHYGKAVFVKDKYMSFLTLKVNVAGDLNVYNEAIAYNAYSTGYSRIYSASDCVIIRNNYLEKSTDSTIVLFAERLTKIQMALEVNIESQKTPILIRCDEKTRTSLEAVYRNYIGDKPVIFGAKALSERPLEVLTTGAPFVADKLREEKRAVWYEALEFLGINTNPADRKKERLTVNEVDSNNEQIDAQKATMLSMRQLACEQINAMYELDIGVKVKVDEIRESSNSSALMEV